MERNVKLICFMCEQDQLSECMDWAERLTMIEKRLRQKDAKLHNLEETLQEMKMGLDRRHRELTLTSHVLSTKEKVLQLAEHQLSVSADELGGHYRALNQRERLIDLPVTTAPLINAGM
jgi:septal ring factor EnvC (AmiA/AmiB activator)